MNHLFWLGGEASFNVYQMALRKIEEFQMQHGLGARPNTGAQLRAGDDDENRDGQKKSADDFLKVFDQSDHGEFLRRQGFSERKSGLSR